MRLFRSADSILHQQTKEEQAICKHTTAETAFRDLAVPLRSLANVIRRSFESTGGLALYIRLNSPGMLYIDTYLDNPGCLSRNPARGPKRPSKHATSSGLHGAKRGCALSWLDWRLLTHEQKCQVLI